MVQIAIYFKIVELQRVLCQNNIISEINPCMDCLSLVQKAKLFKYEMEQVLTFYSLF